MSNIIISTKINTVGNGESSQPALDKTGQFAVFSSDATTLSNDTSGLIAIYLKNTQTGELKAVSNDKYGIAANTASLNPSVSGDGHYVTFESTAVVSTDSNGAVLFPSFSDFDSTSQTNKGGVDNLFLKDTQTGALTLVTGTFGDDNSTNSQITSDGRYVVFESAASNFVSNDTNGAYDIYVEDLQSKTLKLVSSDVSGTEGNRASLQPSLSADGSTVAFASDADNFLGFNNVTMNLNATPWLPTASVTANNINVSVPIDNNANRDVFVKNINTGAIQLASVNYKGGAANGVSDEPSISADGTKVVFRSFATNLIANLIDAKRDGSSYVYLKDLNTNTLTQVDLLNDGTLANGSSLNPVISPDGKYVAFISDATNLVAGDNNGVADVFLKNLSTGELKQISDGSTGTGDVTSIAFSGDSSTLAFSRLSGLDDNATTNVYTAKIQPAIIVDNLPTGSVVITGTTTKGQTLTASTNTIADLDGLGAFSYQWVRSNYPIQGETKSSHTLTADDVGNAVSVVVNYIDGKNNAETVKSLSTETVKDSVVTSTTHAKIYFKENDSVVVANSGVSVFGSKGRNEAVTVVAGSQGVMLDGNVDEVTFVSATGANANNSILVTGAASSNYTFKQSGNALQIYDSSGQSLLVSVPVQDDSNNTLLNFSDGVFEAKLVPTSTGLTIRVNDVQVSSNSALPVTSNAAYTSNKLVSVQANSSSNVYLTADDPITISNDGLHIFGSKGNETVTLTQSAKNIGFDANIEHLVFQKNESDYTFAQSGNAIAIYDSSATSLIATIPVQDNGTLFTFNDAAVTANFSMTAAGLRILLGDFVLKSTPTSPSSGTRIDIRNSGADDAGNGSKQFFVYAGNYSHEIKNFQSGDVINFPSDQIPTLMNSNFSDGKVSLQYASNGQNAIIELTGLANDASLFGISSFKGEFGSASIGSF